MPGLQDPGVAADALGEPRTDLLEQLVGRGALVNMNNCQAPRVQRARASFCDQLLDERPELLGLGFRRFDRTVLDQRRREIPHQRDLLLGGAAKLTPRLTMTHWT